MQSNFFFGGGEGLEVGGGSKNVNLCNIAEEWKKSGSQSDGLHNICGSGQA